MQSCRRERLRDFLTLWTLCFFPLFTPSERGSVYGALQMANTLGAALGPLFGGLIDDGFGWRAIFWFLFVVGALSLTMILFFQPETLRKLVGNGKSCTGKHWCINVLFCFLTRRLLFIFTSNRIEACTYSHSRSRFQSHPRINYNSNNWTTKAGSTKRRSKGSNEFLSKNLELDRSHFRTFRSPQDARNDSVFTRIRNLLYWMVHVDHFSIDCSHKHLQSFDFEHRFSLPRTWSRLSYRCFRQR